MRKLIKFRDNMAMNYLNRDHIIAWWWGGPYENAGGHRWELQLVTIGQNLHLSFEDDATHDAAEAALQEAFVDA